MKDNTSPLRLLPQPEAVPAEKKKRSTLQDAKRIAARKQKPKPPAPITFGDLANILEKPVAYHPVFARIAGGVEPGVFLGQCFYWTKVQDQTNPEADGWFWKTQDEFERETGIKRSGQETSRKQLLRRRLMMEERRPLPKPSFQPRIFFKINKENFLRALWEDVTLQSAAMQQSRPQQPRRQDRRNAADKSAATPQPIKSTENTSQNSSQTTSSKGNEDDETKLVDALRAFGTGAARARKLAALHAPELRRRLEILPNLENVGNPGALICSHLEEPWTEPAKMQKAREADAAAARALVEQVAQQKQREEEQKQNAAARALDDQLDAHFKSLSADDRADVDELARQRIQRIFDDKRETPAALAIARRQVIKRELGICAEDEE
jgi:hypothetical protein